jgi:hypothetical protein
MVNSEWLIVDGSKPQFPIISSPLRSPFHVFVFFWARLPASTSASAAACAARA